MNETPELGVRGIKVKKRLSITLTVTQSQIRQRLSEIICDLTFVVIVKLLAADTLLRGVAWIDEL